MPVPGSSSGNLIAAACPAVAVQVRAFARGVRCSFWPRSWLDFYTCTRTCTCLGQFTCDEFVPHSLYSHTHVYALTCLECQVGAFTYAEFVASAFEALLFAGFTTRNCPLPVPVVSGEEARVAEMVGWWQGGSVTSPCKAQQILESHDYWDFVW